MIVRQALRPVLIGIAAGIALALPAARLLESQLFGVSATDPLVLTIVSVLLAAVALMACALPARRATRIDPIVALTE